MSLKQNAAVTTLSLFTSLGTLVCCALPALFVALGAGATLAGLVGNFPQLVWLSAHKGWVFGISGLLLVIAGIMIWHARTLPCPADAKQAKACRNLRRFSVVVYTLSVAVYGVGFFFAFLAVYLL